MKIYTDGGCNSKTNKGAWAYAVVENDEVSSSSTGYDGLTTNNKMELTAMIKAIEFVEFISEETNVEIITDSEYVKKGLTEWLPNWKINGWKTAAGKDVKNKDLWRILDALYDPERHTISWTRGHNNEKFNDFVDDLCTKTMKSYN